MNKVKAFNNLLTLKSIFDNLRVIFWLEGGTALGAYRENSFLKTDFDVDVGMYGEDDDRIPQIVQALKDSGIQYLHFKEHPCGEGKQISVVRNSIPIDIYIYYKRINIRWRLMFDYDITGCVKFIPCILPTYLFDNLIKINFMDYGEEFNLPYPTEEYLERQYGNWKEDKTKDQFHWQTDYRCMDMGFQIFPKPMGKRQWILTNSIRSESSPSCKVFEPHIRAGIKLFPLVIDKNRNLIDGKKRLATYRELGIPMVECYVQG